MRLLRRACIFVVLAAALLAAPIVARAAPPPPVPPIQDADRYQSYTLNSPTDSVQVAFPVFGDCSDIVVALNGVPLVNNTDFTCASTSGGSNLDDLPLPITDLVVTFATEPTTNLPTVPPSSGMLTITGAWHPRDLVQPTAPGINRREFNQSISNLVAAQREFYHFMNNVPASGATVAPGTPGYLAVYESALALGPMGLGTSVNNPGTGVLEALVPVQTVTGPSKAFATIDLFKKTRRSNSGSAMSDTLPASTALGMVNGARIIIANVDASAADTLTAGAGTSIASACSLINPGSEEALVYDAPTATLRGDQNSCGRTSPALSLSNFCNLTVSGADITTCLQSAINAAQAAGACLVASMPPSVTYYKISSTIAFGSGSAGSVSPTQGYCLHGVVGASAAPVYGGNLGLYLKWNGSSGGTMFEVSGPLSGFDMASVMLNCNNTAAIGIQINGARDVRYIDNGTAACTSKDRDFEGLGSDTPSTNSVWHIISEGNYDTTSQANAIALNFDGVLLTYNSDVLESTFTQEHEESDGTDGVAVRLGYSDSTNFIGLHAIATGTGGCALKFDGSQSTGGNDFPLGIEFFGGNFFTGAGQQPTCVTGTIGINQFFGYGVGDGELTPTNANLIGTTSQGVPFPALTANEPVFGGGAGGAPFTSNTFNTALLFDAGLTVTSSFTATGLVTNGDLANPSTTVNGQTCTLGSTCTITATAGSITPGATTITSGTTNGLLYDNGGKLGNLATGNYGVLATGSSGVPAITQTPTLGGSGVLGSVTLGNATSGTVTLQPTTGALGTQTASLPANTGIIDELNYAATFSAIKTFGTGDLVINGGAATAGLATVTSGGVVSSESNATVAQGGTGGTSASGTLLDNITGFSSTGLIDRTGAGAYSFTAPGTGVLTALGDATNAAGGISTYPVAQSTLSGLGTGVSTALGNAINAASGVPNIDGSITTGNCLKWGPGIEDSGGPCGGGGSTGANPSATAGPSANNGSATTFMRSDASPAVQIAGSSQFGLMEPDGTTMTCPSGVCSVPLLGVLDPTGQYGQTNVYIVNAGLSSGPTSGTLTANRFYQIPVSIPIGKAVTTIAFDVTTVGTGSCDVGIYNNVNGQPTTLVVDAGAVPTTSTGVITVTISQTLYNQWYFLAADCSSTTPTVVAQNTSYGSPVLGYNFNGASSAPIIALFRTLTYGTPPFLPSNESTETYSQDDAGTIVPVMGIH